MSEFISSVDVVVNLKAKLAQDQEFLDARYGDCREYPQHARIEFVEELIDQHEDWNLKARDWDGEEDYCNVHSAFLNDLLLLIARNWEDLTDS